MWDPERYAAHPSHFSHEGDAYHETFYPGRDEYHYDSDHHYAGDGRYEHYS